MLSYMQFLHERQRPLNTYLVHKVDPTLVPFFL